VRPDVVVGVLPQGDYGLGFLERVEDLLAQALVAQLCSEISASLHAKAKLLPWTVCTSIWRSFNTTCSALVFCPRRMSDSFGPS
jgi:hypothetical protein